MAEFTEHNIEGYKVQVSALPQGRVLVVTFDKSNEIMDAAVLFVGKVVPSDLKTMLPPGVGTANKTLEAVAAARNASSDG
jgi:hypothetical protein